MTKSELRILLWITGVHKESYFDNHTEEMTEGITTGSERLSNAAIALRDAGFPLRIDTEYDRAGYLYTITKTEVTDKVRHLAYKSSGTF